MAENVGAAVVSTAAVLLTPVPGIDLLADWGAISIDAAVGAADAAALGDEAVADDAAPGDAAAGPGDAGAAPADASAPADAGSPGSGDAPSESVDSDAPTCNSFAGGTLVLMADGPSKPIDQVKVGDKIENSTPDGLAPQTHTVTALHITQTDRAFDDVTVSTPTGSAGSR